MASQLSTSAKLDCRGPRLESPAHLLPTRWVVGTSFPHLSLHTDLHFLLHVRSPFHPARSVSANASSSMKSPFSTLPQHLPSQHQVLDNIYVGVLSRLWASDDVDPSSLFSRTPRPGLWGLAGLQRLAEGSWGFFILKDSLGLFGRSLGNSHDL